MHPARDIPFDEKVASLFWVTSVCFQSCVSEEAIERMTEKCNVSE